MYGFIMIKSGMSWRDGSVGKGIAARPDDLFYLWDTHDKGKNLTLKSCFLGIHKHIPMGTHTYARTHTHTYIYTHAHTNVKNKEEKDQLAYVSRRSKQVWIRKTLK